MGTACTNRWKVFPKKSLRLGAKPSSTAANTRLGTASSSSANPVRSVYGAFRISAASDYDLYDLLTTLTGGAAYEHFPFYEPPNRLKNNASSLDVRELHRLVGHNLSDLVLSCRFNGRTCGTDDFRTTFTPDGICYTWNALGTRTVNGTGDYHGLRLVLNAEKYEYMRAGGAGPGNYATGVKVIVHDRTDTNFEGKGFLTAPGTHTKVALTSQHVQRLPFPYGNCTPDAYMSLSQCKLQCRSFYAQEKCGCMDAYMDPRATGGRSRARFCSVWQRFFEKCVLDATREMDRHELCDCPVACDTVNYVAEVSSSSLHADGVVALLDAATTIQSRDKVKAKTPIPSKTPTSNRPTPAATPVLVDLKRKALKADEIRSRVNRRQIARDHLVMDKVMSSTEAFDNLVSTSFPLMIQGVESHLIHMREEMNKRYKEHNHLLESMKIIYEWFFKREVQDRDARVLSQIALGYNLVLSSVEHRLRQMVTVSQDQQEYRRMLNDVIVSELNAHKEVAIRGREALHYLDDCFRKETPCYRWVPLNESMLAAMPKGFITRESTKWKLNHAVDNLNTFIRALEALVNVSRSVLQSNMVPEDQLDAAKRNFDLGARRYVSYKNLLLSFEYYTRGDTITAQQELLDQKYNEGHTKMAELFTHLQAQRAAVEAILEDALPSLKQGKWLLKNFYMDGARSRRELAQFFRSPRMRVVEREIAVFMAETRVQHNYLKDQWKRISKAYIAFWTVILTQSNSKTYYQHKNSSVADLTMSKIKAQVDARMEEMYKSANSFLVKMQGVDGQLAEDLLTLRDDLKPFAPAPVSVAQGHSRLRHPTQVSAHNNLNPQSNTQSSGQLPPDTETIVDEDAESFIRENLLLVDAFFAADGRQLIIHRPAYDIFSLLCDIGGALALLCGASILTSLELIDVLLHHACKKLCKKL